MTETTNGGTPPPPKTAITLKTGGPIKPIIPTDFEGVWRMATIIYNAGMAPKDYLILADEKKNIDQKRADEKSLAKISVALMHGLEIGLPPMQAIQKIAIINGRPCVWGDAVIGLVLASNTSEYIKEYFEGTEGTDDYKAVCVTKRRSNTAETRQEFSVKDAKKARLWDERPTVVRWEKTYNNDSPWYRFPKRMLQMRARIALRDAYADVLGGLHIAEEFIGGGDDAIDVTPPEKQPLRKAPPPPPGTAGDVAKPKESAKTIDHSDLDIPEALRRTKEKPQEAVKEEKPEDTDALWLESLENSYSGCQDLESLNEEVDRLCSPMMEKVSHDAWHQANKLYDNHVARITE